MQQSVTPMSQEAHDAQVRVCGALQALLGLDILAEGKTHREPQEERRWQPAVLAVDWGHGGVSCLGFEEGEEPCCLRCEALCESRAHQQVLGTSL